MIGVLESCYFRGDQIENHGTFTGEITYQNTGLVMFGFEPFPGYL